MQTERRAKVIPNYHCPICALNDRKAAAYVSKKLSLFMSPYDILLGLKSNNFIPVNRDGIPISTPNRWRDVLAQHMNVCLQKDFESYEKSWKKTRSDSQLTSDFNAQAIRLGLMKQVPMQQDRPLTPALRSAYMAAIESGDMQRILELPTDTIVTKDELLTACQHYLPAIITNQMAIIIQSQHDFLEGRTQNAPVREFGTVSRCLELMKEVLGVYGIEKAIKSD